MSWKCKLFQKNNSSCLSYTWTGLLGVKYIKSLESESVGPYFHVVVDFIWQNIPRRKFDGIISFCVVNLAIIFTLFFYSSLSHAQNVTGLTISMWYLGYVTSSLWLLFVFHIYWLCILPTAHTTLHTLDEFGIKPNWIEGVGINQKPNNWFDSSPKHYISTLKVTVLLVLFQLI